MKRLLTLLSFFIFHLSFSPVGAQTAPERTGGVYYAYPVKEAPRIAIPEGYEPFYISHYGRHGSRWLPSQERYDWVMAQFSDNNCLTPLGKSVKRRLKKICKNAQGNAGQLTPLGAAQHRGIARRMVANYPEVFLAGDTRILARSSTSPRCRASMLAFVGELPVRGIKAETNPDHMAYINHESAELKALTARTRRQATIGTERFIGSLFKDATKVADAAKLLSELHTIASDMQDIPLRISLWDIFTPEEMLAVHDANNERMTICNGDTLINDGIPARSSIALWQNIEQEADAMMAQGAHGASLRFGHDTALFRLLTLLGVQLPGTGMEDIIPMAANVQMIFLKNKTKADDILVAFLLNERPRPLKNVEALVSPFLYRWADVKQVVCQRIHALEHLRQLSALNTMVGTATANTRTAGLFGKGSEEKGQTLPAVLVPNGQTFWTPQTQDTERKCIAPYYYQDTLFQGIRASHWLVGGCTQDYGSFTVGVFSAGVGFAGTKTSTPFSHADEISHPYYYAVTLPHEHLFLELTGLSHAAIMRITPLKDGPVELQLRANSDEEQGGVVVDTQRRQAYGFNPVHRIYQGWGESAGFSGHVVVQWTERLVASHPIEQGVALSFDGRRGQPIVLRMATSFTSREGAERNLQAEAANVGFEQMEQQCIDRWTERFHTIDVDDPDTARVNQFYGALYRASFLPREMSDVDGHYPKFGLTPDPSRKERGVYSSFPDNSDSKSIYSPPSQGGAEGGSVGESVRYGDFSMWDTYRALHPLLCLIAPKESAQMMQSLVGMASEGGWLPIFPCWNSYTAAMIGDHCTSVLADAYVKGIRGFDAEKAYQYMRKNAFTQPATYEEYQDGMGRRALDSYLRYGFIPLEDSVKEAFHQQEQTSRTLEYAYDDFCVAQMAKALMTVENGLKTIDNRVMTIDDRLKTIDDRRKTIDDRRKTIDDRLKTMDEDYRELMRRSANWRNVINPLTGWADGRHADGRWEDNRDLVNRQPYITEGATCHYTWYVPHDIPGLIRLMGGEQPFTARLDSMFTEGRYWHGNEPCHQVAWLYSLAGHSEKTRQRISHILRTEYNDTPGGLSGNDDAGQMSAWQLFASMGFYPVCPATPQYVLGGTAFQQLTLNLPGSKPLVIRRSPDAHYRLNGHTLATPTIGHADLLRGGTLDMPALP